MAQLIAIGYTALGGLGAMTITFGMFGWAVRNRSTNIAPRCTARSPDVIYNPNAKRPDTNGVIFWWRKRKNKMVKHEDDSESTDQNENLKEHVQYRGGPAFGWIPWTLSLSYDTLLQGVPGTGTRKGGMEGAMLKVNLDGIVLLRFHALALKVVTLTTVLVLGILLPMNLTAPCVEDKGILDCESRVNITTYEMTTLRNIPGLSVKDMPTSIWDLLIDLFTNLNNYNPSIGRLYIVVIVSWIITLYTMQLLSKEWPDALALRRVYYLESSHFEIRREELEATAEYLGNSSSDDEDSDVENRGIRWRRQVNKALSKGKDRYRKKKTKPKRIRPPWIPHPEQRETVPNIELYSVLVGNLPSQPSEVINGDDNIEAAFGTSEEGCLHWQLQVATTFFDQCVPNQPGFSSSVAAITILPDADKLAFAWRKWYKHVHLLRKLRFVRLLIAEMRHYDINYDDETTVNNDALKSTGSTEKNADNVCDNMKEVHSYEDSARYNELWKRMNYKYDVFGTDYEEDVVSLLVQAMNYGPEQTAAYSREFAQGASACCPNGCAEERTRDLRIDELLDLEMEVKSLVEESFTELKHAQISNVSTKNKLTEESTKPSNTYTPENIPMQNNGMERMTGTPKITDNKNIDDVEAVLNNLKNVQKNVQLGLQKRRDRKRSGLNCDKETVYNAEDLHSAATYEVDNKLGHFDPSSIKAISGKRSSSTQSSINTKSTGTNEMLFRNNNSISEARILPSTDILNDAIIQPGKTDGRDGPQTHNLHIPEELPVQHQNHRAASDNFSHGTGHSSRRRNTRFVTMTNDGKVHLRDVNSFGGSFEENEFSALIPSYPKHPDVVNPIRRNISTPMSHSVTSTSVPSRRRLNTGNSFMSSADKSDQWAQVEEIVNNNSRSLSTGVWQIPEVKNLPDTCATSVRNFFKESSTNFKTWASTKTKNVVDDFSNDKTFAVVTFTSRQAAVAARHCIADGRGEGKWEPVRDIPVPPLADAAVCDFKTCRGCCRPVSLTTNPKHQLIRKFISWGILTTIYIFSTFAINLAASLIAPNKLKNVWPALEKFENMPIISGIIPALLFSLFFALCPIIFKVISNFGSNAVSVNEAEYTALLYYWWFMLITAFGGSSIGSMVLNGLDVERGQNGSFSTVLVETASSLATQTSANWLNWIIFRTSLVIPLNYMLQINSYIFEWLGWRCCRRCVMGGGPGGPIPYRIYIDSGVVFLCTVALSPVAPLVAPAALIYFLYCTPLWRRNLIFMYRPKFDAGGLRWPFLSDIYITSILVAQILLTTVMTLRQAGGPAILAALSIVPVLLQRRGLRLKYLSSYLDAALLQTSQLDNWDSSLVGTSEEEREQYRKFLVDAHKAAYVPICIAGGIAEALTAEPAVVVPHVYDQPQEDMDELNEHRDDDSYETVERPPSPMTVVTSTTPRYIERANQQRGAFLRRVPGMLTGLFETDESHSIRSRTYSHTAKPPLHHQHTT